MRLCYFCSHRLEDNKFLCPVCHHWQQDTKISNSGPPPDLAEDMSVLLSDVESAEKDRLSVGVFNEIFGGKEPRAGIVRTSTVLIGGKPGEVIIASTQREVLYIASEEDLPEIKSRAERLGLKHGHLLRMVPAMSGDVKLESILANRRPSAIILDSLQGFANEDLELSVQLCVTLKKFAVTLQAPVIISSQVNKDEDFAGLNKLQHAVDELVTFRVDEEFGQIRYLEVLKNRNGRAFVELRLEMTERGLIVSPEEDETEEPDDDP